MSRTHKDRPRKFSDPESAWDYGIEFDKNSYHCFRVAGAFRKKKRHWQERGWMKTPMWWIHEYMTVPQRRRARAWEHRALTMTPEELEDTDPPDNGRKPHIYYW